MRHVAVFLIALGAIMATANYALGQNVESLGRNLRATECGAVAQNSQDYYYGRQTPDSQRQAFEEYNRLQQRMRQMQQTPMDERERQVQAEIQKAMQQDVNEQSARALVQKLGLPNYPEYVEAATNHAQELAPGPEEQGTNVAEGARRAWQHWRPGQNVSGLKDPLPTFAGRDLDTFDGRFVIPVHRISHYGI